MITENLSTLKIHKLTEEQYRRELEAGRIDENAIYLTPDDMSALDVENLSIGGVDISEFIKNIVNQMMDAGRIIGNSGGDTNG